MQHDELIWQLIGHGHCSFKSQVGSERAFCRNEYNVNGLCCRSACPLANSRYATVREHEGRTFLYMKTIERAHSPKNLWEKVPLPKNYASALEVIDEQLAHWPNYLIHKNKQRLTKIVQYLIRMSKIKQSTVHSVLEPYSKKEERKDAKNEDKALRAARVEVSIEKELLSRLKQGAYGGIYNFPEAAFSSALTTAEGEEEEEDGEEEEEDELDEDEEEFDDDGPELEAFIAGDDSDIEEEEEEEEEIVQPVLSKAISTSSSAGSKGDKKKGVRFNDSVGEEGGVKKKKKSTDVSAGAKNLQSSAGGGAAGKSGGKRAWVEVELEEEKEDEETERIRR